MPSPLVGINQTMKGLARTGTQASVNPTSVISSVLSDCNEFHTLRFIDDSIADPISGFSNACSTRDILYNAAAHHVIEHHRTPSTTLLALAILQRSSRPFQLKIPIVSSNLGCELPSTFIQTEWFPAGVSDDLHCRYYLLLACDFSSYGNEMQ